MNFQAERYKLRAYKRAMALTDRQDAAIDAAITLLATHPALTHQPVDKADLLVALSTLRSSR